MDLKLALELEPGVCNLHPSSSFQKQEAGDRDLIKAAVVRGDAVENSMQAVFSCLFI